MEYYSDPKYSNNYYLYSLKDRDFNNEVSLNPLKLRYYSQSDNDKAVINLIYEGIVNRLSFGNYNWFVYRLLKSGKSYQCEGTIQFHFTIYDYIIYEIIAKLPFNVNLVIKKSIPVQINSTEVTGYEPVPFKFNFSAKELTIMFIDKTETFKWYKDYYKNMKSREDADD